MRIYFKSPLACSMHFKGGCYFLLQLVVFLKSDFKADKTYYHTYKLTLPKTHTPAHYNHPLPHTQTNLTNTHLPTHTQNLHAHPCPQNSPPLYSPIAPGRPARRRGRHTSVWQSTAGGSLRTRRLARASEALPRALRDPPGRRKGFCFVIRVFFMLFSTNLYLYISF